MGCSSLSPAAKPERSLVLAFTIEAMNSSTHSLHDRRQYLIGLAIAISGAILFSTKAIVAKLIYRYQVDAVTLIAFRMLFSLPIFALIAIWQAKRGERLSALDRWRLVGLGLVGYYLSSFLDFLGLQYISAGLERLILFLTPSFVLLISAVFLKRKVRSIEWVRWVCRILASYWCLCMI